MWEMPWGLEDNWMKKRETFDRDFAINCFRSNQMTLAVLFISKGRRKEKEPLNRKSCVNARNVPNKAGLEWLSTWSQGWECFITQAFCWQRTSMIAAHFIRTLNDASFLCNYKRARRKQAIPLCIFPPNTQHLWNTHTHTRKWESSPYFLEQPCSMGYVMFIYKDPTVHLESKQTPKAGSNSC